MPARREAAWAALEETGRRHSDWMDSGRVLERLDTPRFWWRGADRPKEQPRLRARTRAPLFAIFPHASELIDEPHGVVRPARRGGKGLSVAASLVIAGSALAFVGWYGAGFPARGSISEHVDQLMILAGLGADEIHVSGHRYTLDSDIFAALDLERPTSLLRYSSETARRRVEAISWVNRASVTRILPNVVEVRITERQPIAVWLHDKSATLVDAEGRHLAHVTPSTLPALPRVAGAGAPEAAGALLTALAAFPALAHRVTVSNRVGQRRWSLELDNGTRVHLPAEDESTALARLMQLADDRGLLDSPRRVVDLRIADRVAVAPRAPAPAASVPERPPARKSASAL